MSLNDINSLAHSKWNCKYHIVFAPKYRRMVFYGERKIAVGKILRQLCEWKGVKIVTAELCPDHVHMLVEIPPKMAVSSFMGYLKGKSTTMIYEQFPELKYKYRNREFWCSCQTALRVARVPRGARAMPASEKPRVSRGDGFCV